MNNTFYIDLKKMIVDFSNYDVMHDKYFIKDYCRSDYLYNEAILYVINRNKANEREFRNFDYEQIRRITKVIYGDGYQPEMIEVISLIQEKFIKGFLNIPHLDDLFSEHYFEYEWEMHAKLDPQKANINFYRDHYFHQIRNLYEIFKLFQVDDGEFLLKPLLQEMEYSTGNTARYCNHMIDEAVEQYFGNTEIREKLINKLVDSKDEVRQKEYFKKFARSFIVRGALYVAALTHDIGYPIERHIQRNREFVKFLSNPAYNKNIFDFDSMRDVLEKSILFDIVGADEIRARLYVDSSQMDHGIISAIVLLMHYYEHGAIYSLDPLKRAIIELAAIISYDHTARYKALDDKNYRENYPAWHKNPLSIIFRLADDIQEWDRVYFEVKPYPNIRICPRCKMPMLKKQLDRKVCSTIFNEFTKYQHVCGCVKESTGQSKSNSSLWASFEHDYGTYKQQMSFNNQKINYIIACNRIYYTVSTNDNNDRILKVLLDYNPYKLMELLLLTNTVFHEHRKEEIAKLKKFVEFACPERFEIAAYIHFDPKYLLGKIVYDFLAALWYVYNAGKDIIINKKDRNDIEILYNFTKRKKQKHIIDDMINKIASILSYGNTKYYKEYCSIVLDRNLDYKKLEEEVVKKSISDILTYFTKVRGTKKLYAQANSKCQDQIDYIVNTFLELYRNGNKFEITPKDCKCNRHYIEELVDSQNYQNEPPKSATDNFYGSFYVLGLMNDFTEMVKGFISQQSKE